MYKIAVVGDYESVYGFATLGLEIHPVTLPEAARNTLKKLVDENYGVIYITEVLAEAIKDEIELYKSQISPAIVLIPGTYGNTGDGVQAVKNFVEQAVGSDILFGNDRKQVFIKNEQRKDKKSRRTSGNCRGNERCQHVRRGSC